MYSWSTKFGEEEKGRDLSKSLGQELGPGWHTVKVAWVSHSEDKASITFEAETGESIHYKISDYDYTDFLDAFPDAACLIEQINSWDAFKTFEGCILKVFVDANNGCKLTRNAQGYVLQVENTTCLFKTVDEARNYARIKGWAFSKPTVLSFEKDSTYDKHNRRILFGEYN
jgi:hypothetical protein